MKPAACLALVGLMIFGLTAYVAGLDGEADRGREIYAMQKCALCHSIEGIGGKKMPLDRVGSRLKREDMSKWIRTPKAMKPDTTMKAYPNLPERDLSDLTTFLLTLR